MGGSTAMSLYKRNSMASCESWKKLCH